MKNPTVGLRAISSSKKKKEFLAGLAFYSLVASRQYLTWVETTESTSMEILLNSSKHPQDPVWERPMKIWAMER